MSTVWKKLQAKDRESLLSDLRRSGELWVPQKRDEGHSKRGRWAFKVYDSRGEVHFPESIIDVSVKELFFPKRRPVATFDGQGKWSLKAVEPSSDPRIIMGLHPCDVQGILYMDKVFADSEYKDTLYEAERERTVLVGMTCEEMGENCHCTDRGGSPDNAEGMDAVFTVVGNGYLFKALTEKGEKIVSSPLLRETSESPEKRAWEKGRFPVASPKQLFEMYDDDFWNETSDICLTCGVCTYVCPTCLCFLIADEKYRGHGERLTVWDSCQFASYSRMAGGHNPRKTNTDRVRNRTLDKFAYSAFKYGRISCTGCGRCASVCPLKRSYPSIAYALSERVARKKEGVKRETFGAGPCQR